MATLFYVANWRFVLGDEAYFGQVASPSPLRHAWSLAVEEQFYIVYPLLLVALLALVRRRATLVWSLAGLAAALRLQQAGVGALVVEAAERPGGRVRTDEVDGTLLDRGFQLLNPAYPEVRRVVDVGALGLRPFGAGVVVAHGDIIKAVLAAALGMPLDDFQRIAVAPGSLSVVKYPGTAHPTVTAMSVTATVRPGEAGTLGGGR